MDNLDWSVIDTMLSEYPIRLEREQGTYRTLAKTAINRIDVVAWGYSASGALTALAQKAREGRT